MASPYVAEFGAENIKQAPWGGEGAFLTLKLDDKGCPYIPVEIIVAKKLFPADSGDGDGDQVCSIDPSPLYSSRYGHGIVT